MLAEGVDGRYAVVDMEKGKGMKDFSSWRGAGEQSSQRRMLGGGGSFGCCSVHLDDWMTR